MDKVLDSLGLSDIRRMTAKNSKDPRRKQNINTFVGPDGVQVDEEGYIIRTDVGNNRKEEDDHFYSSSDDDSEDDEKQGKRFKFEIKPIQLTNGGPSVAELRKTVKRLSISPSISHPNNMTRCKSYGSLSSEVRMTPVSVNSSSSQGPSPLTLGLTNVIPIAVAIQECISARFKGSDESKCRIQIIGSLKIAFPSGIIQVFANNTCPALLSFKLTNSSRFERLIPNKDIVMQNKSIENGIKTDTYCFDMNMVGLINHLKKMAQQSPNSRYFNAEILKYQLKARGATFCPLQVVSHWKCEPTTTGLKVDYKYNACALSSIQPLKNVTFSVNVDGGVKSFKTTPNATWNEDKKSISWQFDDISVGSEGKGLGSLKAKFDVSDGPSTPGSVDVQFSGNSATFSGVEFALNCIGYKISLMKKQISTGRYLSEADSSISYACI